MGSILGNAHISMYVRAHTQTHTHTHNGCKLYTLCHLPSLFLLFGNQVFPTPPMPPPLAPGAQAQPSSPSHPPPPALALPGLGDSCSSEAPRAALGRGPPESPTLMGEKWAWPTTPWTASRWDKFLSATCTSSGAFTWLGRWAGLCSRGGVSSSW